MTVESSEAPKKPLPPGLWHGQGIHFFGLAVLLAWVALTWSNIDTPNPFLFWLAIAVPIIHQIFVWIVWRLQLRAGLEGERSSMRSYVTLFFILFGGRFVTLFTLGWADRGSLNLPTVPRAILTTVLLVIGLYAMYSVKRYFGLIRAAGADHFDPAYREMPLVSEGIFRFTSNGMYLYAFFLFWAISIGLNSLAALVVAAFSHAYIWVHYFATEKPDMNYLYGAK